MFGVVTTEVVLDMEGITAVLVDVLVAVTSCVTTESPALAMLDWGSPACVTTHNVVVVEVFVAFVITMWNGWGGPACVTTHNVMVVVVLAAFVITTGDGWSIEHSALSVPVTTYNGVPMIDGVVVMVEVL